MKVTLLASAIVLLSSSVEAVPRPKAVKVWPGWKGVKQFFVFGDSYTQTGFNVSLAQPSLAQPLGNPAYPGWTASNGPNWVGFLTETYNASQLLTYNLAYGGATIDSALIAPYEPTVLSLKNQVQNEFLPNYGPNGTLLSSAPWSPSTSLFAVWIGINDVGNSYWGQNATLIDEVFKVYSGLVNQIYGAGARNFLFLTVPPVQRSPLTTGQGNASVALEGPAILDFNSRIRNMTASLQAMHSDATVFVYDAYNIFNKVLDDPKSFEQTAGLKNTTAYCAAYQNGTPDWYTLDESCGIPVNEYFWLNTLHPTFPMHNATAASIAKFLSS